MSQSYIIKKGERYLTVEGTWSFEVTYALQLPTLHLAMEIKAEGEKIYLLFIEETEVG